MEKTKQVLENDYSDALMSHEHDKFGIHTETWASGLRLLSTEKHTQHLSGMRLFQEQVTHLIRSNNPSISQMQ